MIRTRGARQSLAGLILLLAGTLVIAACGGGGVESDEVASVVQQAVAAAVAAAVPAAGTAGATAEEIRAMVEQAVQGAAPDEVTAAEIGTMVEAAVAAAASPAVSAAEIESLVTTAVEEAAAGAATPLSASEVQAIVAAAIAAIPPREQVVIFAEPTDSAAEEMAVIVEGGIHRTIHELGWGGMEVLDPAASTVWEPPIFLVWDRLVALDIETGRAIPALAESWETNADATRWTFNLRMGVTHSDGTPFTAADVAYTTARHLDPNIGSGFRAELEIVDPDGIETPNDYTIVYNLQSANVDFPATLASRYFRMVPEGSGDDLKDNPIGTGAFTVASAEPDGISVFVARDDYWDGAPLLGRVTFASIADHDAQINAALAGQVDIAGVITSLTASQASLFEGDPDFYLQESPRGQIQELIMITTEPPFDDPRVRLALKLVVDPEEMIAIVGQGSGFPACNSPA